VLISDAREAIMQTIFAVGFIVAGGSTQPAARILIRATKLPRSIICL
jgi:hypothetical protein